jgi:glycosyltransferase involved in cell wall biosynthesis
VVLTGFVPDLRPYLDRAAVVVAPLRVGGGMRVKVVEALAAGKAVVASGRAISGLSISDGEQVLLAETDHEFGDAVVRLLRDPERRAALAHRAHAWACAHLGWDEPISAYERLYESLVSESQR